MSFTGQVKEELIFAGSTARHCCLAELAAIVSMSGFIEDGKWIADGENEYIIKKQQKLIKLLDIDVNSKEGRSSLKLKPHGDRFDIDNILIERSCCKQAYLRGAFLAKGSVTNPEKGYHFEIVCDFENQADALIRIIKDFDIEAKKILRKKYYVVYIKDGSMIVDILNIMGAHKSLMNMENVRILKDMRNRVNRRVNCEAANITKAARVGVKQQEDIEYIINTKGLKYLPEPLRMVAQLRLEEPELPLKELGEMMNPPLGKSGVNHRLRKISEIANELRRE